MFWWRQLKPRIIDEAAALDRAIEISQCIEQIGFEAANRALDLAIHYNPTESILEVEVPVTHRAITSVCLAAIDRRALSILIAHFSVISFESNIQCSRFLCRKVYKFRAHIGAHLDQGALA